MKLAKQILKGLLIVVLIQLVLAAVGLGLIYGWAWYHDRQDERTAREVIDPKAAAYLAEQYPGNDFEVGKAYHVFIDNCFRVKVRSQSSRDTHFWLPMKRWSSPETPMPIWFSAGSIPATGLWRNTTPSSPPRWSVTYR